MSVLYLGKSVNAVKESCTDIISDVTHKASIESLIVHTRANLPPIGGVVNGAMVLEDSMFFDMSHETMQKVLRPKVNGSMYLDELFFNVDLEFFIMFSSLASIIGNRGQSNYTAANMY